MINWFVQNPPQSKQNDPMISTPETFLGQKPREPVAEDIDTELNKSVCIF
jgi:hypothetical protein